LQAHKTFKYLQWIAAVVSVSMVILAAFSLGSGVTFKKLLLPIAAVISAKAGLLAHSFKQRLEFVDYRWADPIRLLQILERVSRMIISTQKRFFSDSW
jgi:hypothetical protein